MSKHTHGPWKVDTLTVGRYKGVNVETLLGDRIASAGHSPFSLDEKQANARLIAAAPELLEALKMAMPLLIGSRESEIAKAAIVKADGKENE